MRAGLARVAERLGPPGGTDRAADAVLDAIEHSSREAGSLERAAR
jgi:hypothetical protein